MEKIVKVRYVLTFIILIFNVFLAINYYLSGRTDILIDICIFSIGVILFNYFYENLNQNTLSYSFLLILMSLHLLGLYGTTSFGIRFDRYMHFLGGFTIGLIVNRLFINNEMYILKRFFIIIVSALGIGVINEIVEWIGFIQLGYGEGLFRFGNGDYGMWHDTIIDLIFNGLGGLFLVLIIFFKNLKGKKT